MTTVSSGRSHIPVHYLYVFLVGAAIVGLSLTGIASSYLRMLLKVSHYNELRTEKEDLRIVTPGWSRSPRSVTSR